MLCRVVREACQGIMVRLPEEIHTVRRNPGCKTGKEPRKDRVFIDQRPLLCSAIAEVDKGAFTGSSVFSPSAS